MDSRFEFSWYFNPRSPRGGATIAHGVYYGVYLEYAHERKYAILERTITKVGMEQIMPAFHNFLDAVEKKVGK